MAAGILSSTKKNSIITGKISLRALARLIELSKRTPAIISQIAPLGGEIDIQDPNHLKTDYFNNPWLEVLITIEDPQHNMTYNHGNKVATIDKTVNVF